jgi:hypothetical protein
MVKEVWLSPLSAERQSKGGIIKSALCDNMLAGGRATQLAIFNREIFDYRR